MKILFVGLFLGCMAVQTQAVALAYDCPTVRSYVSQYGVRAAYRWARLQGYSVMEIAMVRAACFRH